jgi:hypothetical protein
MISVIALFRIWTFAKLDFLLETLALSVHIRRMPLLEEKNVGFREFKRETTASDHYADEHLRASCADDRHGEL